MLLSRINILPWFLLSLLISCKSDEPVSKKTEFVAKVGNSFLTKESISNFESSEKFAGKFRQEIVNDWIEKELLYQIAKDEGITKEKLFRELIEQSKKELAASLYLEKYFENNLKPVTETEVQSYFSLNQEQFRFKDDAYLLNIARFSDFETAEKFREEIINTSWIRAVTRFSNNNQLLSYNKEFFLYKHQVNPIKLLRSIEVLNENEFSISVQSDEGNFIVVQLIAKIKKGEIPDFALVKDDVQKRYYAQKKKELYRNLISELAEKYEIIINKEKIDD